MFTLQDISRKFLQKQDTMQEYLHKAQEKCMEIPDNLVGFEPEDHEYAIEVTKEELGLDDELINTLLEDYVTQILKNIPQFRAMVKKLKKSFSEEKLTELRDLAHKNLGVARNLRIKDAQKILQRVMREDDLERIELFLDYLEACAIKLKPETAYKMYTK